MDLFARTQAEFERGQAEFLTSLLATSSRCAGIASTMYEGGNTKVADQKMADAENGYATVLRFLSDPQCTKRLTIKAGQDLRKQMKMLRNNLDGLKRLQKGRLPE